MTENDYILMSAMVRLDTAVMSLRAVDLPDGWEEEDLALADGLRAVTASRDKIMTELERRVGLSTDAPSPEIAEGVA